MERDFRQLFRLGEMTVPGGLSSKILTTISRRTERAQQRQVALFFGLDLGFLAILVWTAVYLGDLIGQSGLYYYLITLWLDGSFLSTIWLDVAYSILSTLPILGLAVFLVGLAAFSWSAGKTVNIFKLKRN